MQVNARTLFRWSVAVLAVALSFPAVADRPVKLVLRPGGPCASQNQSFNLSAVALFGDAVVIQGVATDGRVGQVVLVNSNPSTGVRRVETVGMYHLASSALSLSQRTYPGVTPPPVTVQELSLVFPGCDVSTLDISGGGGWQYRIAGYPFPLSFQLQFPAASSANHPISLYSVSNTQSFLFTSDGMSLKITDRQVGLILEATQVVGILNSSWKYLTVVSTAQALDSSDYWDPNDTQTYMRVSNTPP